VRKLNRTLLLLLLLAVIFPFTFPLKEGRPLLSLSDLGLPKMPSLGLPGDGEAAGGSGQPVIFYRWQGSDGRAQYSSEPPASGVAYEVIEVDPDTNLIQAVPVEEIDRGEEEASSGTEQPRSMLPSPLTVSPEEAMQLFKDAREIREISEQRLRQTESLAQ
jgi:hypothetical protein